MSQLTLLRKITPFFAIALLILVVRADGDDKEMTSPVLAGCGEKCNIPGVKCQSKLQCLHLEGLGDVCVKVKGEGEPCRDPCWTCAEGLTCNSDLVCERPVKKVGCAEKCGVPGVMCKDGLTCTHVSGKGDICAKPMGVGGSCEDPCWQCEDGLVCNTKKRCIGVNQGCLGKCELHDGVQSCQKGFSCEWVNGVGRACVKKMGVLESCNDPCWKCKHGLVCNSNKRCIGTNQGCLGRCELHDGVRSCKHGYSCEWVDGVGHACVKLMGRGGSCGDPCWKCKHGLKCNPWWKKCY